MIISNIIKRVWSYVALYVDDADKFLNTTTALFDYV